MINYKNLILISFLASFIFSSQMGNYYNGAIPSYTKTPKKGKINFENQIAFTMVNKLFDSNGDLVSLSDEQKTSLIGRISKIWGVSAPNDSDSQKSNQSSAPNSPEGNTPSLSPLLVKSEVERKPAVGPDLQSPTSSETVINSSATETPKILDLPTISGEQPAIAFQKVQEQEDSDELDIPAFLRRQAN